VAEAVYLAGAILCAACAALLFRGYGRNHVRLLLWSALCFVGLTANNAILFVDLVMVPAVDLSLWRALAALGGLAVLVYGLVWDAR
jgi:hypothetical protein